MILRLDRESSVKTAGWPDKLTWGDVYADGSHECCTLEDEVREEPGQHVSMWKIAKRTAIGAGVYRIGMEKSPKFGDDTITVYDVPGFDKIRMHGGDDIDDTEGCPLVGSREDRLAGTLHGAKIAQRIGTAVLPPALAELKKKVRAALDRGEKVFLQVRNAPEWYLARGLPIPKAMPYAA